MSQVMLWATLLLVVLVTGPIVAVQDENEAPTAVTSASRCSVDDDEENPLLDNARKKGFKFLKKLISAAELHDQQFDFCGKDSRKFMEATEAMLIACPFLQNALHAHWRHIIDYVNCVCTDKKPECQKSYDCFFAEYGSPLISRCDALYDFNVNQKTQSKCHFLRENVNCKDALVASKCGNLTGTFAYHGLRLYHDSFLREEECHLPREPKYKGFKYTDMNGQCQHFMGELKACARQDIGRNQMLQFRSDNDLIVETGNNFNKKSVRDACKRFRSFKQCVLPVRQSCPRGVDQLMEIDKDLRQYVLKMDFVCGPHKKDYMDSIRCYNKIHDDETVQLCNDNVWDDVTMYLNNLTSHEVHCRPTSPTVQSLKIELETVALCYKEVVEKECSPAAGQTLYDFISIIFKDPAYLRLNFKPDCQLHDLSTSTPAPRVPPTLATRRRHVVTDQPSWKTPQQRDHVTKAPTIKKPRIDEPKSGLKTSSGEPWTPSPNIGPMSGSIKHRCSVLTLLVTFFYAMHHVVT